jgi:hypothetical protein
MTAEKTPKETLEALRRMVEGDDAEEEAELDRIEALSDAEVEAELRAEGIDTKAADAHAKEIYARLHPTNGAAVHTNGTKRKLPDEPAKVVSLPPARRRTPRLVWLAVAALIVASAAYAARAPIVRLFSHEDEIPPNNPSATQLADSLCDQAVDACRAKRWGECGTLLDQAVDKHSNIQMDDRYIRARWAIEQAQTVDSNLPWFDKTIGPGLHPRPGSDKPMAPR